MIFCIILTFCFEKKAQWDRRELEMEFAVVNKVIVKSLRMLLILNHFMECHQRYSWNFIIPHSKIFLLSRWKAM